MNFNNQLQIIEGIIQGDEVDTRVDCPFCNHTNTLTIKKSEGKIMWYCFHASCNTKGIKQKEMSMEDELAEYLSYILELEDNKVKEVLSTFHDYSKEIAVG